MITYSKEIYPKVALMKAAYSFTDRAYIHLDADESHYKVEIKPKEGCEMIAEDEFTNEMLTQCVRHEIYMQTKDIRELLTARAMASTLIQDPGEAAEYSDQGLDDSEEDILKDWFEANDQIDAE